jgi:hypothetical protein
MKVWQPYVSTAVVLTAADWDELEAAGGIALSEAQRRSLQQAVDSYRAYVDGYEAAAAPAAIRSTLKALDGALGAAHDAIGHLLDEKGGRAALRELRRAAVTKHKRYEGASAAEELRATLAHWRDYVGYLGSSPRLRDSGRVDG